MGKFPSGLHHFLFFYPSNATVIDLVSICFNYLSQRVVNISGYIISTEKALCHLDDAHYSSMHYAKHTNTPAICRK